MGVTLPYLSDAESDVSTHVQFIQLHHRIHCHVQVVRVSAFLRHRTSSTEDVSAQQRHGRYAYQDSFTYAPATACVHMSDLVTAATPFPSARHET